MIPNKRGALIKKLVTITERGKANSLFTRMALQTTSIDPASFTAMRLVAGALTLALIVGLRREKLDVSTAGLLSAALLFTSCAP